MATVNIPAGPKEKEGTRRIVDLEEINSLDAIKLVDKRHKEDIHTGIEAKAMRDCQICAEISKRFFVLFTKIKVEPNLPISIRK